MIVKLDKKDNILEIQTTDIDNMTAEDFIQTLQNLLSKTALKKYILKLKPQLVIQPKYPEPSPYQDWDTPNLAPSDGTGTIPCNLPDQNLITPQGEDK
jgi:hypothetical protein